jgi:hypothetical protein
MSEEMIPILSISILFGVLPALTFYYLHKVKTKKFDTLVKLAELGGSVDPDMMKMLDTGANPGYRGDYRIGLIWLAIGIPLALGVLTTAGTEGAPFAMIPMFIGFAFLLSGKLRLREADQS